MAPPMQNEPFRLRTTRVSPDLGITYYLEAEGATAAEAVARLKALIAAWAAEPWGSGGPG